MSNFKFLDLGIHPLANSYLKKNELKKKESKYRLKVIFNKKNYLVRVSSKFSSKKFLLFFIMLKLILKFFIFL